MGWNGDLTLVKKETWDMYIEWFALYATKGLTIAETAEKVYSSRENVTRAFGLMKKRYGVHNYAQMALKLRKAELI